MTSIPPVDAAHAAPACRFRDRARSHRHGKAEPQERERDSAARPSSARCRGRRPVLDVRAAHRRVASCRPSSVVRSRRARACQQRRLAVRRAQLRRLAPVLQPVAWQPQRAGSRACEGGGSVVVRTVARPYRVRRVRQGDREGRKKRSPDTKAEAVERDALRRPGDDAPSRQAPARPRA